VQKDPVHQIIEHIDLLVVKKGEKIQVQVPVVVVGEPAPGTIVNLDAPSVALEVEATHIPEHVEVSVEGLEDGTRITAADLELPTGAALQAEGDLLVVAISIPAAALASEEEIAAADAAVAEVQSEESAGESAEA
jgi:large subunit ribosomal protein L25